MSFPCSPCEISPWILLAQVTLPAATGGKMSIVTSMRPMLVSTAVLQKRLIECCCKGTADLDIQKKFDGNTYTITVGNTGSAAAENVVVTDVFSFPVEVEANSPWTKVSNNPTTLTASLGDLTPDASISLTLTLLTTPSGIVTNTATVKTDSQDGTKGRKTAIA
jgi:hypothetical protein